MRKRLDIQEAVGKPAKTLRTLRIFVSNTAADQPMQQQQNDMDEDAIDLSSGSAPSWTLRIEGRLLDVSTYIATVPSPRPMLTV